VQLDGHRVDVVDPLCGGAEDLNLGSLDVDFE